MAKVKADKVALSENIAASFNKASAAIVAEYSGISAEELVQLRRRLRKAGSEFKVIKNRVAKKALESKATDSHALAPKLRGPVGVAYVYQDVAATAKVLIEYAKENEKLVITGGIIDGKLLSVEEIVAVSSLPSKEVLIAKMLGCLTNPHRQLMGVLSAVSRNLVYVIDAIKNTKE